ncbi:hypothetical protein FACS18945_4300 [Bacteroidia bacterium]|nr:hypothetical protein FACS18945_4300 [Bacteroidia bacterium]
MQIRASGIYRKYSGTFSEEKYKNRKFTPRFFENEECTHSPKCDYVFPKEYQEIQPYPKDDNIFRDWIDLFDVHKGVPPISTYK